MALSKKQSDKRYETYKKQYNFMAKANKMSGPIMSKAEFDSYADLMRETASLTPNDPESKYILKNVARAVARDQKELSDKQLSAFKSAIKDKSLKMKISEVKKGGLDAVLTKLKDTKITIDAIMETHSV